MEEQYLLDYYTRERDEWLRYLGHSDPLSPNRQPYPPLSRFPKAHAPMALPALGIPLWPILPFYGSSLVVLRPCSEELFEIWHGFSPKDIPRLVDFTRDTGAVQFALSEPAVTYKDMPFLDPIFQELRPPRMFSPFHQDRFDLQYKQGTEAFYELARVHAADHAVATLDMRAEDLVEAFGHNAAQYSYAKMLGMETVVSWIENTIIDDPDEFIRVMPMVEDLLLFPQLVSLKVIMCLDRESYTRRGIPQRLGTAQVDKEFPYEIGRFITKKLLPRVDSFEAAMVLIDNYSSSDLHRLLAAIESGIEAGKVPETGDLKELGEEMDRIWSDAERIGKKTDTARAGIGIGIGIVGALATSLPMASGGIVAGIFAAAVDEISSKYTKPLSERIVGRLTPNYLTAIYDFQNPRRPI